MYRYVPSLFCHQFKVYGHITVTAYLQLFAVYDIDRQQIPIIVTVIFKLIVTHAYA